MKKLLALTFAIAFTGMAYAANESKPFWIDVMTLLRPMPGKDNAPPANFRVRVSPNETWRDLAHKILDQTPNFDIEKLVFGGRDWYNEKFIDTTIDQTDLSTKKIIHVVFNHPIGEFAKGDDE